MYQRGGTNIEPHLNEVVLLQRSERCHAPKAPLDDRNFELFCNQVRRQRSRQNLRQDACDSHLVIRRSAGLQLWSQSSYATHARYQLC
jgi:hypothetical protein